MPRLMACDKYIGPLSSLTHEEIGQRIGSSRETVTRFLSEFKNRRIIEIKGATLLVCDRPALEILANY